LYRTEKIPKKTKRTDPPLEKKARGRIGRSIKKHRGPRPFRLRGHKEPTKGEESLEKGQNGKSGVKCTAKSQGREKAESLISKKTVWDGVRSIQDNGTRLREDKSKEDVTNCFFKRGALHKRRKITTANIESIRCHCDSAEKLMRTVKKIFI